MNGNLRLGKVFGIEIRLSWTWFLIFFLLAWSLAVGVFPGIYQIAPGLSWVLGIVAALLLFVSVLVHEIAHALVARRFGVDVSGITLWIFGGVAQMKDEPPTPKAEFFIAAVGPVVSVAIGLASLLLSAALTGRQPIDPETLLLRMGPLAALFNYLGVINIVLAIFNMIPGFPLDGGRVLRSVLWHFSGSLRKATRWAANAGRLFAWLLIGYGLIYEVLMRGNLGGLWLVFIGWFLNTAAESSYQQLVLRRALSGIPVAEIMQPDVPTVSPDLRVADFVDDYLLRHDYTVYPVERDGAVYGVVTLDDVKQLERPAWETTPLRAIVHPLEHEYTVADTADAWDALIQMLESDRPRLLVTHDDELVGAVSRDAIVSLVERKLRLGLPGDGGVERTRARASRQRGLGV